MPCAHRRLLASVAGVAALSAPALQGDLLQLRDGSRRTGALAACVGASCRFDGTSIPRSSIAWIAFGDVTTPPPPPSQATTDEVHLAGGSVEVSPVVGISLGVVATGAGSHDRDQVSWVRFAAARPDEDGSGAFGAPGEPDPTPEPPPPTPTPPPTPMPTPTATPPPAGDSGARGALWTGTITGRNFGTADETFSDWQYTIDVRLREYVSPLLCPVGGRAVEVGRYSRFVTEGTTMTNAFSSSSRYGSCSGSGVTTAEPRESGAIWWKTRDADLSGCLGADIPTGSAIYTVDIAPPSDATFAISCTNTEPWASGFLPIVVGWIPLLPTSVCHDPSQRFVEGGALRGSYSAPCTGCCPWMEVSWSICREGVACAPPPPPPSSEPTPTPTPDPCPPPANEIRDLNLALDQMALIAGELAPLRAEHEALAGQARQWQNDYDQAARDCGLWQAARVLTTFLLSAAAPTGAGGEEIGQEFANFLALVEKIADDDASWVLPNAEFADLFSAEDVYDAAVAGWSWLDSQDATPDELRQSMLSCGAPTAGGVIDGALTYLRLLERLRPLGDRMNRVLNRARQQEIRITDLWTRYREACRAQVRCEDGDAADVRPCDVPPPR